MPKPDYRYRISDNCQDGQVLPRMQTSGNQGVIPSVRQLADVSRDYTTLTLMVFALPLCSMGILAV